MVPPEEISNKINEVISKYVDASAINLNKLIDQSSINRATAYNAIAIQDVKRLNESGFKQASFFSSNNTNDSRYINIAETPLIDETIEECEYHEYDPITGTNLNNGGDIRISI